MNEFKIEGTTLAGYAGNGGTVVIPNIVTTIGVGAFRRCPGLTEIVIPDSVTTIGDRAFEYCYGLTEIVIPNSVTTIGDYAFRSCTRLTEVVVPDGVTTIGNYAFCDCKGLTEVVIPDSVTTIGYCAFLGCPCEKNIKRRMTMEYHEGKLSECCGAPIKLHDICSECKEHCEPENIKRR